MDIVETFHTDMSTRCETDAYNLAQVLKIKKSHALYDHNSLRQLAHFESVSDANFHEFAENSMTLVTGRPPKTNTVCYT